MCLSILEVAVPRIICLVAAVVFTVVNSQVDPPRSARTVQSSSWDVPRHVFCWRDENDRPRCTATLEEAAERAKKLGSRIYRFKVEELVYEPPARPRPAVDLGQLKWKTQILASELRSFETYIHSFANLPARQRDKLDLDDELAKLQGKLDEVRGEALLLKIRNP